MNWLDWLLIASIFGYVWGGFWTGLIQSVGGLVGLFLGSIVASRLYDRVGDFTQPLFGGNGLVADIVAFLFLFLLINRLVGLAFFLVNKMFNLVAVLPGMKLMNRFGGAVFGLLEGGLFVGISLQFISRLPISTPFATTVAESTVAGIFLAIAGWLVPLFPEFIRQAENAVDRVVPR